MISSLTRSTGKSIPRWLSKRRNYFSIPPTQCGNRNWNVLGTNQHFFRNKLVFQADGFIRIWFFQQKNISCLCNLNLCSLCTCLSGPCTPSRHIHTHRFDCWICPGRSGMRDACTEEKNMTWLCRWRFSAKAFFQWKQLSLKVWSIYEESDRRCIHSEKV